MANVFYNATKKYILNGAVAFGLDTLYCLLVTSSYTPSLTAHSFRSDLTNEVSGAGYTAGGAALSGVTVTQDNTNNRGVFSSNNVQWTSATITAAAAVLYKHRGGAASADELAGYWDFGGNVTSTSGTFTVIPNANGWVYIG